MCGITGYYQFKRSNQPLPDLKKMNWVLAHRGPDDEGFHQSPGIGLAHRRLSIIDLSSAGRQPMSNEDGTVYVTYNGEVYNFKGLREELIRFGHRFTSTSDTEVIVHGYEQWGMDLPGKLRGMFAFAVWDNDRKRMFLVRDHFGIKPLYYTRSNGIFVFASEIKSLLTVAGLSRDIDPIGLDRYLSFLYIPEPETIFRDIKALPAGHMMTVTPDGIDVRRYWRFKPRINTSLSENAAIRKIRDGFEDSVKSMLVADVPVGVFLSGGLDSTGILAMAARHVREPIQTFTVGFDSDAGNWDEMAAARRISDRFHTRHHEFKIRPNVVELLPKMIRHFDQPFANPTAVILYLLSEQTSRHVKVVLAGTGGDEMFAGYPRYQGMQVFRQYRRVPAVLRKFAAKTAGTVLKDASDGRLLQQRLRRFFEAGAHPFSDAYIRMVTAIDDHRKFSLYQLLFRERIIEEDTMAFIRSYLEADNRSESLENLMTADLNTYLPFNQLAYGDRMSMAHSLEVRVPFVDQKLVETAGSIDTRLKLSGNRTKGLFRKAMAPFLPMDIIDAPKLGLNLPISLWFRGHLKSWLYDMLDGDLMEKRGYFHPQAVKTVMDEHVQGHRDHSLFLWALIVLEVWHQAYVD